MHLGLVNLDFGLAGLVLDHVTYNFGWRTFGLRLWNCWTWYLTWDLSVLTLYLRLDLELVDYFRFAA